MQWGVVNHPLLVCDFCGRNHLNGHYAVEASNLSLVIYLGNSLPWICDFYGDGHLNNYCEPNCPVPQEQVTYMSYLPRLQNDAYFDTHDLGWRNYPNYSWNTQDLYQHNQHSY